MSKSENKSKTKKILPNHDCRFSNDLFPLKKCCILHIGNITSNKKKKSIKVLMNIVLMSCSFEV